LAADCSVELRPLKTILIAEHHRPTLEHLSNLLRQAGYEVHGINEPATAMEHFLAAHPDAVLVAVDFPRVDGSHLGQLIRANERGNRMPMLAIDKGHLGRARGVSAILEIKANGYVADPIGGSELTQKLAGLLQTLASTDKPQGDPGLQKTLARPPVMSGELKGAPLPAVWLSLHRLARDGVLVVAYRELTRRVFFLGGAPVSYDSNARQDQLPRWLSERGELNERQAEQMQAALAEGMRVGTALAEAGCELAGEELLGRLRDFTREKSAQVVSMREGRYAFFTGDEFRQQVAQVDVPALAPILDGARRTVPLKFFAQGLKGNLGEYPRRSPQFAQDLGAMGLDRQDLKVAMQMNGRIALRDLIAHGRGDLRQAYSLLWFLKLGGAVTFSREPAGGTSVGGGAGPDVIGPRKNKPLPREKLDELREAAVKIITGSYFRVLGLDISADTEAVERAYHDIAARFHPDSYPEFDTSEIKDLLDSVQEKLAASYRVLSVEDKRRAYVHYLLSRLDVGRHGQVNVDAEILLKRGEAAMKRGDMTTAQRAFEEAVAQNPREPEYYAFLAWATYKAKGGDPKEKAKAAQKVLKKALGMNPYLERAIVVSAIIEGETGDASAARRKLLKVLEMNPKSKIAKAALLKVGR
jgi:CheY-like chemotaxis protein/tetratricopeptide (TPR) repeat protein